MSTPTVSVVTAAYNSAEYIERALESVGGQTMDERRIEHIVVDDGSTDETVELVESFESPSVRLIEKEKNSGNGTVACNRGIERARGEYVTVLDSDDKFLPTLLERSCEILETNEGLDFVYPDYYEQFPDGERRVVETGEDIMNTVKVGMLHRTDRLHEFGSYDSEMIFAEYDLLLRYLDAGLDGFHVPDPLFVYHRQSNSVTSDSKRVKAGKAELREKYGEDIRIREYQL